MVWWVSPISRMFDGLLGNLVGACGCWSCVGVSLLGGLHVWGLWAWVSGASLGLHPLDSALNV